MLRCFGCALFCYCFGVCSKPPVSPVLKPIESGTQLFGKNVSDLQENIEVKNNVVSGNLKYVTGYKDFSSVPEEQNGHFFAMKFDGVTDADRVTVKIIGGKMKDPIELDSDHQFVLKVLNNKEKLKVTYYKDNYETSETYGLFGLTLANKE